MSQKILIKSWWMVCILKFLGPCSITEEKRWQAARAAMHAPWHYGSALQIVEDMVPGHSSGPSSGTGSSEDNILSRMVGASCVVQVTTWNPFSRWSHLSYSHKGMYDFNGKHPKIVRNTKKQRRSREVPYIKGRILDHYLHPNDQISWAKIMIYQPNWI